ncbi:hypothetical protein BISU_1829, partial [Bifidobacterium subtile]
RTGRADRRCRQPDRQHAATCVAAVERAHTRTLSGTVIVRPTVGPIDASVFIGQSECVAWQRAAATHTARPTHPALEGVRP